MDRERIESKYENIVKENIGSPKAGQGKTVILILGLIIGSLLTFSLVKSDLDSPTGFFAADQNIEEPIILSEDIKNVKMAGKAVKFDYHSDIRNNNLEEAQLQEISYNVTLNGRSLGSGKRWMLESIQSRSAEDIFTIHKLDFYNTEIDKLTKKKRLVIDGKMIFNIADRTVTKKFRQIHKIENT